MEKNNKRERWQTTKEKNDKENEDEKNGKRGKKW